MGPGTPTGEAVAGLPSRLLAARPYDRIRGATAYVITENLTMSNHTMPAEANRAAALEWIDAFNARDDRREAGLRTADYIAHTPESIGTETLDSDGWVRFLAGSSRLPPTAPEMQDTSAHKRPAPGCRPLKMSYSGEVGALLLALRLYAVVAAL